MKSVQIQSFFWSESSRIRTEYRDLLRKSSYSVRIRENTDQKKNPYLGTFRAVLLQVTHFVVIVRGVFRIQSNIYDGAFLRK